MRCVLTPPIPQPDLVQEHAVLLRQWARLQAQISLLVQSHDRQLRQAQAQLMRQSVRGLLERSRADWGLPHAPPLLTATPQAQALADALICRTGCVMDDHHWREGDQCRRTGLACSMAVEKTIKSASGA